MTERNPNALPHGGATEWVRVDIPEQPGTPPDTTAVAERLVEALARAAELLLPTVLVSEDRALMSRRQIERAVRAGSHSQLVVTTASVTDTVRTPRGELVDRRELVEVCSPLVIGHGLAERLLAENLVADAISVVDVIMAAKWAEADITTIEDDGSGAWVGRTDARELARARVEP